MNEQLYCSIDWLSVTNKTGLSQHSPEPILQDRQDSQGFFGYKSAYRFSNGAVHLWDDTRPDVHIIYSGKTLRNISTVMSISDLVKWHQSRGHKTTRIDTAIDCFDTGYPVSDFSKLWSENKVKTHARHGLFVSDPRNETGDTFYVGSLKRRRKLLRIYDKAKEQKVDKDWLRLEVQWGQGAARSASRQLSTTNDVSSTIIGQITGFCDFQHPLYAFLRENAANVAVRHDMPNGASDRLRWLWRVCIPALMQQELETPGITTIIHNEVIERLQKQTDSFNESEADA